MGWPKKNEKYRLYFEKRQKTYLLVQVDHKIRRSLFNAVGELSKREDPDVLRLDYLTVSITYLHKSCRRVEWNELPVKWRKAFLEMWFLKYPVENPFERKGLWRVETFNMKTFPDNALSNALLLEEMDWYENVKRGHLDSFR